ncbi:MAG: hypothetical protein WCW17_02100 [Patescibacteria group bacterium]|jgi:hypothetical protein
MKKYLPNLIIMILIAVPFVFLVYYYSGLQKSSVQTGSSTSSYSFEYFGIVKANQQISISLEDNYFYYSYGVTHEPLQSLPN